MDNKTELILLCIQESILAAQHLHESGSSVEIHTESKYCAVRNGLYRPTGDVESAIGTIQH